MSVSFIGIGNMGAALAIAFLKHATSKVTIWNRSPDREQVRSAVNAGALLATNLRDALANDLILLCVVNYDAIYSIFEAILSDSSIFANKTIVNLTNGTPAQALKMQAWAKSHGASHYFDGAVMVPPQLVGTEHSFVLYGGESEETFKNLISEQLQSFGGAQYTGADVRSAATDDLAALSTMYGMFAGMFAGFALLKRQNLQNGKISPSVKAVVQPVMTAMVPYISLIADAIDRQDWDNNLGNPLNMQALGIENITQALREQGIDSSALDSFLKKVQKTVDGKGGDVGLHAVHLYHDEQY